MVVRLYAKMAPSLGCYTVDSVNVMRSCANKSCKNYSKNVKEGLLRHMVYIHLMWLYRNLRTPPKKRKTLKWKNSEMGSVAKRLNNASGHCLCLSTLLSLYVLSIHSIYLRTIFVYTSNAFISSNNAN